MSDSATASPAKDLDIFGKELGLTAAERNALSEAGEVFLRKVLQVDTHSKKGDPTEPRIMVISSSRCSILTHGPSTKLETTFNFLRIQHLECTESKLIFHIAGEARTRMLHSKRADSVQIIALITAQLKSVFPVTPLELVLKLTFDPDSLRSEVSSLRDNLMSAMNRVDPSSIQGFITSYGFLCDFFSVPFNNEVSWFMKHVYLSHGIRDLNMSDFNHLTSREILPMMSTLRHNQFFEGIVDKSGKVGHELFDELSYVLNVSRAIKQLVLNNSAMRPENLIRLSNALKNNPRTVLTHLDLSDNSMDDKTIEALGGAIESLPHGLQLLKLVNCKITPRGGSLLAQSMKQNKNMQFTLVHLDLSSNPLGPDPQGSLAFIQEPQTIATLYLSKCNLNFEFVLPVLIRGCQQHLRDLNLSHNFGKAKKGGVHGPNVAHGFQQFLSTAISIYTVNIAGCKLASDVMIAMLEGLTVNPNVNAVDLDVSSNDLGAGKDPGQMAKVLARTKCLHQLNMSECGLDQILPEIISAVDENQKLKHFFIGKNFGGRNNIRAAALSGLSKLLNKEDCHLESLCLTDSKLKDQTTILLEALEDNTSLTKLDISGNQMSNRGARSLAKTLHTNCSLRDVRWDNNDTTVYGFRDVANALENNYTLRVMPLPLHDISKAGKGVEEPIQKIQVLLCRNHSDERLKVELAALHRGRLLTATQHSSVVSRELVQLEDLLQWAEGVHGSSHEHVAEALEIKKQANKVVQLTDGLYSPQVESEQFEAITAQVKSLLDSFMDNIFTEHVNETSEQMVTRSAKASSVLLSEEATKTLRSFAISKSDRNFVHIKKAVAGRTAPEIANHVSSINLDVAANISELVVEQTLMKLERANHKLSKLKKESQGSTQTPDTKVSRNFTFRVQDDESPRKKKKRVRKPDDDDVDQVDLPSNPLVTDGPTLQHLGKTRPKPARLQRSTRRGGTAPPKKPSAPSEATISEAEVDEKPIPEVKPKSKEHKAVEPLLPPKPKPKEETPVTATTEQEEVPPPPAKTEIVKEQPSQPPPSGLVPTDSKPSLEEAAKPEVVKEVKEEEAKTETPEEKVEEEGKQQQTPAPLADTEADEILPTVEAVETIDAGLGLEFEDELAKLDALQKEMETLADDETKEPDNDEKETEKVSTKETTEEEPPKVESPATTIKDSTSPEVEPSEAVIESSTELPPEIVSTPEPAKTPTPEPVKKPSHEVAETPTPEAATPEPTKVPTPETEVQSTEAVTETTPEPAKVSTPEPVKKITPEPTKTPTPEPTKKQAPEPTKTPTPEPTKKPTPEPAKKPTPEPAKKPTPEPAKKPTPEPAKKPTPEPTKIPTPEPAKKPTPEPAKKLTPEPARKPTPEPTKTPTPEPVKKPAPEPVKTPTPVLAKKPTPEPAKTPTPEPAKKPTPEPTKKPTPEPAKKPAPEPTKISTPEPARPKPAKKPVPKPTKVPGTDTKKEEDNQPPVVQPSSAVLNGVVGDSEKKTELAKESPKPMPRPIAKPRVTHTDTGEPSMEERKHSTPTKEPLLSEKQSTPGGRQTPEPPVQGVEKRVGKEGQKHDRKKGTFSKLFGKKEKVKSSGSEELKPPTQQERVTSGDWEVVEPVTQPAAATGQEASPSPEIIKKPPPVVREKPKGPRRAQSVDERDSERVEQQPAEPKRVPVMHTSAPMSELANVLKKGVGVPLKPPKPSLQQDSPSATKRAVTDPPSSTEEPQHRKSVPGPAPKPRPKPRPSTKKAASSGDVLDNISEPAVQKSPQRSPQRSPHHSPQQPVKSQAAKDTGTLV